LTPVQLLTNSLVGLSCGGKRRKGGEEKGKNEEKKSNRPWGSIGLRYVEVPTPSRQSAYKWQ
jgi:hypothetical protein